MNIVSLFSGAGGFDLGLVQVGHRVIWANDIDRDCVATYKLNIGHHITHCPIEEVRSRDIPDADVVIGGFPCQGFSQANMLRSPRDSRNHLYLQFLRVLAKKRPRYFLAENVRGILSLDKGRVARRIQADFEAIGYRVDVRLFNTADYGVPQTRWRVIFAGTRSELSPEFSIQPPKPTHSRVHESGSHSWVTIREALEGIPEPDEPNSLPNHVCSKYKVTNRNFTGHRKTDPFRPSPTILARGNGKGGVVALQHPNNHRRMSIREQATIQTFPLDFEFIGKMNSCYRQVGNAVPVLFAKHLGVQLAALEAKIDLRR